MSDGSLTKIMGWDGSEWQKLGLLFGYNDTYKDYGSNLNLSAGDQDIVLSTVPAGEIWIVTHVGAYMSSTSINIMEIILHTSAHDYVLYSYKPPTSDKWHTESCKVYLNEGNYIKNRLYNCSAGDDGYIYALGYKMKIS